MALEEISLSVRTLTEFILRSGSIDNRYGGGNDRAQEGARIHRMLQKQAGSRYHAEIHLKDKIECDGIVYLLEGRADGVVDWEDGILMDEIKTVACPIEMVTEDYDNAHWGQVSCYAYMYAKKENLSHMTLQLTYFQVDTEEVLRYRRKKTFDELQSFVMEILEKYKVWADWQKSWEAQRNESLINLKFPFPEFRDGQRKLAGAVYQTIALSPKQKERTLLASRHLKKMLSDVDDADSEMINDDLGIVIKPPKTRLFCQAPTGIGKTVSTVFPSVKAMGEGKADRIFYLTAKTIARQAAEEAMTILRGNNMRLKTITLTAKDKVCFQKERDCNPEKCIYADGYYDRVNDAVLELLKNHDHMTRTLIEEWGHRYKICPFELALDLTLWCDCIICDYNYLFDPVVSLQRFFGEGGGEYIFLIDEAHNLIHRAREMYSAPISYSQFTKLRALAGREGVEDACQQMENALSTLASNLLSQSAWTPETWKGQTSRSLIQPPTELSEAIKQFNTYISEWLESHKESLFKNDVLQVYFACRFYEKILELYDDGYVTFFTFSPGEMTIELLCIDPSSQVSRCLNMGRTAVLFSATMSPPAYYASLLGGADQASVCTLQSPFPQENCFLAVADKISTKYAKRAESIRPIAEMLGEMVLAKNGNYMAFFPSYAYMEQVFNIFCQAYPSIEAHKQGSQMSERDKETFLERFDAPLTDQDNSLLSFCVLGGIFSEGIDLKGERLVGAAVVGVGLPQIGPRLDLFKQHFDQKNGCGFDYAYKFPGINKVLQAGGRVIRGMKDKGVVILIDDRFSSTDYSAYLPEHWLHRVSVSSPSELSSRLSEFWNG